MTYANLGLVQPPYGDLQGVGKRRNIGVGASGDAGHRIIPFPEDPSTMAPLVDAITGEKFTFKTQHELGRFKYQRFMQRYLRCVQYVDPTTIIEQQVGYFCAGLTWVDRGLQGDRR